MKAQVSGEVILVIAVLLSVSLLLVQVQQLANFQIASTKEAMTKSIAKDIAAIIDGMGSVTGNATYIYEPPRMWYSVNITEGFVFARGKDGQTSSIPYTYDCVIPNSIENEREIIIQKTTNCIMVGTFEKCTASADCDSGYCWSTDRESYICHDECAGHLHYSPDNESCCPGKGWDPVTSLCYDTSACSGSGDECNSTMSCCFGMVCMDATGPSDEGHCCINGWVWNSTSGHCQRPPITLGILVIPINWDNNVNYNAVANSIGGYYLERLPLKDCPAQFEILKVDSATNYGSHWTNGYCDVSDHEQTNRPSCYSSSVLSRIHACANEYSFSTGIDYDFVVGVDDDNIALYNPSQDQCEYNKGGWSDGAGFTLAVIVEATDVIVAGGITTHELGHEFGLMEQYCDCTGTSEESRCSTTDAVLNPLRYSLGCGGVNDGTCYHGFSYPVSPSVQCPFVDGNYDMNSLDAGGNPLPNGNRSAMSNKILDPDNPQQGYYSIDEFNIISQDPRMGCFS
ncbi:MAG: hypothetical protein JW716_05200 [Candidatus Aenigmarchaeota archaeon]|nr:hypothetical protein [Candidatus Aenigmarchaeota archaeon]